MFYQSDGTQVNTRPAPGPVVGTPGWVTGGNPATGVAASDDDPDVMNMLLDELAAICLAAGLTLDKTNNQQVLQAILSLIGTYGGALAGDMRNGQLDIPASGVSTTSFTADQLIVASALNGSHYTLSDFNASINLASVGAGGMDTGTAPANGYVALYAIYDPATQTAALLGANATSGTVPAIYANGHMPAGYTASALVSVLPISGMANEFKAVSQNDRQIWITRTNVLGTVVQEGSPTAFSVLGACPFNARMCSGDFSVQNNAGQVSLCQIGSSANSIGLVASAGGGNETSQGQFDLPLIEDDNTLYYTAEWTAGGTFDVFVSGYTI